MSNTYGKSPSNWPSNQQARESGGLGTLLSTSADALVRKGGAATVAPRSHGSE